MVNVSIITQARLGSTRFPDKLLKEINGLTLLEIHLNRLLKSKYSNGLTLATTKEENIDSILSIARKKNIKIFQGSTSNVLSRFFYAALEFSSDYIVRVTSDCPLIDSKLLDEIVDIAIEKNLDYYSNILEETYPDGQDIEVFKFNALKKAFEESTLISEKEHVTPYIRKNSSYYNQKLFSSKNHFSNLNYGKVRMTVDEPIDFFTIQKLIENLGFNAPWKLYADFLIRNPNLFKNQDIKRNQGLLKSLIEDKNVSK